MMKDIFLQLLPEFNNMPKDYVEAISNKYDSYIKTSEIPSICYGFDDIKIIPNKLANLYNQINTAVKDRYSFIIRMNDINETKYICYLLLNNYFKICINNDELLETILYLDTNLVLDDFKRLMDYKSDELSLKPTHSLETLYVNIESVPYVIWDKFSKITSNYDRNKIYNILSTRERKGLSNIFIIDVPIVDLNKYIGDELASLLQNETSLCFDCTNNIINNSKEVRK